MRTFAAIQSPNERTANTGVGEAKAAIQSPYALTATTSVDRAGVGKAKAASAGALAAI